MDEWGGVGWGQEEEERRTKEGEWRIEPGHEMTLPEHGFKYQNKVPAPGVGLTQLSLCFSQKVICHYL